METDRLGTVCLKCSVVILTVSVIPGWADQKVFVLEDGGRGVCGYTSETKWAQVPKEKDIEFTAVIDKADGVVKSVLVQRYSEDTATYDEYDVDKDGIIRRLKRTVDVIPDRLTREQIWDIRGGKPVKVADTWWELRSRKPHAADKELEDIGQTPVIVRLTDFPFYSVMTDQNAGRWPGGVRCVGGSMDRLENGPSAR